MTRGLKVAAVGLAVAWSLWTVSGLTAERPAGGAAVGAGPGAAQTKDWRPVGISGGGSMYTPAISPADPKLMMINCDMSGAYMSTDGGLNWEMIHHAQLTSCTFCRPGFHPTERETVYAASGWAGRLKVSHDAGQTWSDIGNLPAGRLRGEIGIDPGAPERMLVGLEEGVWRSADAGRTWTKCAGVQGVAVGFHFDQSSPAERRITFAATEKGVWRSKDGGATWTESSAGLPWRDLRSFSGGSNARECTLYCSIPSRKVDGKYGGGVFRSSDRGDNWESAMGEGINKDTERADQWAMGDMPDYLWVLANNVRPSTVYALNTNTGVKPPHHATVYRSDDAGGSWRATFKTDPRFGAFNAEPDWQVANLRGEAWQEKPSGAAGCASDPDRLIHCGSMLAFVTENGGKSWRPAHTRLAPGAKPEGEQSRWLCNGLVVTTTWHYYVDPFERNRHYIAYTDLAFARSLDGGESWNWWGPGRWGPWRNTCYELAFDPTVPGRVWGAFSEVHDIPNNNIILDRHRSVGPGGVCVSTDFGATWKPSNQGLPECATTSVVLDPKSPVDARVLYASLWEQGVWRSDDGGLTWAKKSLGLGHEKNMRVYRLILHPDGTLFALITAKREGNRFLSEGAGLWRSADRGENWEAVSRGGQFLWPKDFSVDPADSKILYVGAADAGAGNEQGGLWRTKDGGKTWTLLARKGPQHFGGYLSPRKAGWIYMTLCEEAPGAGLWLSRDDGKTWTAFARLPFRNIQRVEFDPADDSIIYATTFGGSIWRGPAEPADR